METSEDSTLPRTRAEAKETGSRFFFNGVPCPAGHIARRYVSGGCVICAIQRSTRRQAENPDAKREYDRIRYKKNPKVRLAAGKWKAENPEKMEESREKWRRANPEKHRESQRKWTQSNPEKVQANVRARRARKREAEGSHTAEDIEEILARQKYKCAECGCSVKDRKDRQVDHIMPLKLGGSNWPNNLQILCNTCNKIKAAKHPQDFALERGRLI